MKQVLITLGVLLLAMFGYYWLSNRFAVDNEVKQVVSDREVFFQLPENVTSGTEVDLLLKAKYESGKIVSYVINFNYDPAIIKILNVEVNKEIFDKIAVPSTIDEVLGKVMVMGENIKNRDKLTSGEIILATIKVKGLRKGGTMIYSSRRAEVGILDVEKVQDGNFKMPNFEVNFL